MSIKSGDVHKTQSSIIKFLLCNCSHFIPSAGAHTLANWETSGQEKRTAKKSLNTTCLPSTNNGFLHWPSSIVPTMDLVYVLQSNVL